MTARVFVIGADDRGWSYVLADAQHVNRTHAVGRKRWPTRAEAAAAGRARAAAMRLDVA